ncbi:MAG: hypothetical protein HYV32_00055 [Candidatus Kerfeldbacteria bacterium]|nr:hypothetical protein [Candidatus Kerfeldbacteria bacterium]
MNFDIMTTDKSLKISAILNPVRQTSYTAVQLGTRAVLFHGDTDLACICCMDSSSQERINIARQLIALGITECMAQGPDHWPSDAFDEAERAEDNRVLGQVRIVSPKEVDRTDWNDFTLLSRGSIIPMLWLLGLVE